jgi:hypothetical protein
MSRRPTYPSFRYDPGLVLKVPPTLWLLMLFLVRHFVLVGLTFTPRGGSTVSYLRDLVSPLFLVSDLPALLVLVAAARRRAGATRPIRALWSRGRVLLGASAVLYLVLLAASLWASGQPLDLAVNEAVVASVCAHLLVLVYLVRSRLAKDVFEDFP